MKRLCILIVMTCICFGMVACNTRTDTPEPTSTTNVTAPNLPFPENTMEVLQYLKDKYGEDFTCVGFTVDEDTFHCSSKSFPVILVQSVSSLDAQDYDASDFTEKYADNGYLVQANNEIHEYYEQYLHAIGESQLHVYMPLEVFPSGVTTQQTYSTNRSHYPKYFTPELYILHDGAIDEDLISQLHGALQSNGEQVTVFVVQATPSQWSDISTDDVVWNLSDYTVLHSFATTLED